MFSGSLGISWTFGRPVTEIIWSRIAFTLTMGLTSLIVAWAIAIPMGIYVAKHQYTFKSQSFSFLTFLGMSLPEFFLAYVWYYITSLTHLLPSSGTKSPTYIYMNFTEKVFLNFDSKDSKNSQTREKLKRKTDVPPQLSIEVTL